MWIAEFVFIGEVDESECGFKRRVSVSWRKTMDLFKDYGVNLVLMLLVMDVSKVLIGEHRPHFLDTCKPDAAENCTVG